MDIQWTAVIAFIISSLLIPAIIYIWKTKDSEIKENKKQADAEIKELKEQLAEMRTKMETHELKSQDEMEKMKLDLEKTKTNYVGRFGELGEKIDDKFTQVNKSVSTLALEVREALILIKSQKNDRD